MKLIISKIIVFVSLIIISLLIPVKISATEAECGCEITAYYYPCGFNNLDICVDYQEGCSNPGSCTDSQCGPGQYSCNISGWPGCCDVGEAEEGGGSYDVCRPNCPYASYPADNSTIEIEDSLTLRWEYSFRYDSHSGGYYWCRPTGEGEYHYDEAHVNLYKTYPGPNNINYSRKVAYHKGTALYSGDPSPAYTYTPGISYGKSITYDDNLLNYSGSWQNVTNDYLINSTAKTTSQTGASATYEIDGEGFVISYPKRPYGGKMKVTIDGDSENAVIIDQQINRDKIAWQKVWTSPTLSNGTHNATFSAPWWYYYPNFDAAVVGNTVYDDNHPAITFTGGRNGWTRYDHPNAYGGYFMQVSAPGVYGYFTFTGDRLSIIYGNNMPGGTYVWGDGNIANYPAPILDVYIDNVLYQIQEGYSDLYPNKESDYWQHYNEWVSPKMANGHHTITVEKVDPPVTQVGIDAISVANYSTDGVEGQYKWTIGAVGGNTMGSINCPIYTFTVGSPEVSLKNLVLKNRTNTIVPPGVGGANSVCNEFPRGKITFDATVTSLKENGGDEISKVYVGLYQGGVQKMAVMAEDLDTGNITSSITGLGASITGNVTTSVNGNDRTVSFPISYTGFPLGTYEVKVYGYISKGLWMSATPPRFLVFDQCAQAWWQVGDSDIQSTGDLTSMVPTGSYFNLPGLGGFPGIPAYATTTSLTAEDVSAVGWLVNSSPIGLRGYDYAYFANQIPDDILSLMNSVDVADVSGSLSSGGIPDSNDYYWYKYDGVTSGNQDLTIPQTNIGTRKVIVMVDNANVNITGNINLVDGQGFFMLVVNGNIVIDPTLGDSGEPDLEGLYFANGAVSTGIGETQLWTRGSIVAYGGVALERDLGNDGNSDPSEYLEYAPDQIMLFPKVFGYRRINWKEVAP
jgi:hypothetical protein